MDKDIIHVQIHVWLPERNQPAAPFTWGDDVMHHVSLLNSLRQKSTAGMTFKAGTTPCEEDEESLTEEHFFSLEKSLYLCVESHGMNNVETRLVYVPDDCRLAEKRRSSTLESTTGRVRIKATDANILCVIVNKSQRH